MAMIACLGSAHPGAAYRSGENAFCEYPAHTSFVVNVHYQTGDNESTAPLREFCQSGNAGGR